MKTIYHQEHTAHFMVNLKSTKELCRFFLFLANMKVQSTLSQLQFVLHVEPPYLLEYIMAANYTHF